MWMEFNEFQYADRTPRWSADGQVIVVNPGERLLGVNLNGGEPFVIRGNTGERQYSPSLSPDGRVAYQIGFDNRVSDTYERHTAIADLSGSEVEFLPQERQRSSIYPVWSPDGKRLAFITEPISSREGRWLINSRCPSDPPRGILSHQGFRNSLINRYGPTTANISPSWNQMELGIGSRMIPEFVSRLSQGMERM